MAAISNVAINIDAQSALKTLNDIQKSSIGASDKFKILSAEAQKVKQAVEATQGGFAKVAEIQGVFAAKVKNTEAAINAQIAALRQVQSNVQIGGALYQKAATQIQQYQQILKQAGTAAQASGQQIKDSAKDVNLLQSAFGGLRSIIATLGIGLTIQSIAKVGTESEASKNKLKALTAQYGELDVASQSVDRVQKLLGMSAIEARDSYAQLYGSLRGTGLNAQQLEVLFVGLNKAAKLSGGGAQEAQAGILQLKQAFSAGTLSGDELRSVLENMPAFAQAVGKETDKLGITSNATAADIKRLGAEGKITSDVLFKAAQSLALMKAPPPTTAEKFSAAMKNMQERIAEAFGPAAIALITKFTAVIGVVGDWFTKNQAGIAGFAKFALETFKILGPIAVGIGVVAKAVELWALRTKALAAVQAFVTAMTGPAGMAKVAAAVGIAAGAYAGLNGIMGQANAELAKQKTGAAAAQQEFQKMATSVAPLPNKLKEAADETAKLAAQQTQLATAAKQGQLAIDGQLKSLELGASISSARYEAEKAFNDLRGQQLERAYQLATSEQERADIAIQIFNNAVQAAKIEYNQALERINLEKEKLRLQYESQRLKLQEIEAEGKRAQIVEKDAAKRAEIEQRTKDAIASQQSVVDQYGKTFEAQQQIAQYQEQAAKAQYETKILAAQTALEQKLVSEEIGMSAEQANNLSNQLVASISPVESLASGAEQVASNAENASYMFIQVANNANSAAAAINNAANAQERLNALQAQGGGKGGKGGKGGSGGTQKAAEGAFWKGGFSAFAKGGIVKKPTLGLIGEGGENEYVIPESKAKGFAMNYLMGQRGVGAIPGFAQGGYVGSTPTVSIQTGPVTQMNGTNYVTTQDLGRAVQFGVQQTLNLVRNDIAIRSSLGMG